jgi:Tfp pilus assembly protein PilX
MFAPRPPRDRQRGNSLLLALIVMSALATLGSLTVVSMQSSLKMVNHDRAQAIALYAAESGAAVAMVTLRQSFDPVWPSNISTTWSNYVNPNNSPIEKIPVAEMPSNGLNPNPLFSADQNAWYEVEVLNNRNDLGFGAGGNTNDTDGILILRSTGHGPQGSIAIVEWEIQRVGYWASHGPPPAIPDFVDFPAPAGKIAPSVPWTSWIGAWGPTATFPQVGVVLRGWHLVSL